MKAAPWRAAFLACILLAGAARLLIHSHAPMGEKDVDERADKMLHARGFAYLTETPANPYAGKILEFEGPAACPGRYYLSPLDYQQIGVDAPPSRGPLRQIMYMSWRGTRPDRRAIEFTRVTQAALALFGLSPYVFGGASTRTVLEIDGPACPLLATAPWPDLWRP